MKNNEFEKAHIKNCMCCYFDDIIKLKDFDIDNILLNGKFILKYFHLWLLI